LSKFAWRTQKRDGLWIRGERNRIRICDETPRSCPSSIKQVKHWAHQLSYHVLYLEISDDLKNSVFLRLKARER
jgi:hypothetical protein